LGGWGVWVCWGGGMYVSGVGFFCVGVLPSSLWEWWWSWVVWVLSLGRGLSCLGGLDCGGVVWLGWWGVMWVILWVSCRLFGVGWGCLWCWWGGEVFRGGCTVCSFVVVFFSGVVGGWGVGVGGWVLGLFSISGKNEQKPLVALRSLSLSRTTPPESRKEIGHPIGLLASFEDSF